MVLAYPIYAGCFASLASSDVKPNPKPDRVT